MRTRAQNVGDLSTYILDRKRESDYEVLRMQCNNLTGDINSLSQNFAK
jgi:hypothetical protein